jgi:diphthamide biosynthesis protein 2
MTAFSASGEDIINRTIDLEIDDKSDLPSSSHEFDAFYELERTADEILKGDFRRVSQFLRLSKTACLTSGLRCR